MDDKTKYIERKLVSDYRKKLLANPKLQFLFFELTNGCNLKCLHCGSSCGEDKAKFLDKNLIFKTLKSVKENYGTNDILICLTGGEPLLHKDFFEIVDKINKMGFCWGMTTNATLITEEVAKKLLECRMMSVSYSIDGNKESHDILRGKQGAYVSCVNGIKNGQKIYGKEVVTMITTVFHKKNIEQLEQIYQEVKNLNVDMWRPINIEPIGRANEHKDLFLDNKDYIKLFDFIKQKQKEKSDPEVLYGCSHYLPTKYEKEIRESCFLCGSGIFVASVLCNGDIYSCLDIERRPELVQGNVKTDDFSDVWKNRFKQFRKDRSDCDFCKGCSEKEFCFGDSAHTYNYDEKRPNLCLFKKLKGE